MFNADNAMFVLEAKAHVEELVYAKPLLANVKGYAEDGAPCVILKRIVDDKVYLAEMTQF